MELADRLEARRFGEEELLFNADSGFHTELAQLPESVPVGTVAELERYLARLRQFPRHFDEAIALLERGLARGMTPPRVAIPGIEATAAAHVVADPEASVFWAPFAELSPTISGAASASACVRRRARRFVKRSCPSYAPLHDFLVRTRTCRGPGRRSPPRTCRTAPPTIAISIRHFTTLDLDAGGDPPDRPRAGRADPRGDGEVKAQDRIRRRHAGLSRLPAHRSALLRRSAEELLKEASYIAKRMDAKLPAPVRAAAAQAVRRRAGAGGARAEVHQRTLRRRRRSAARSRAGTG